MHYYTEQSPCYFTAIHLGDPFQVLHHLDNPEAMAAGDDGVNSTPAVAVERLAMLILAAVLEVDKEEAAVAKRVEKRLAKDSSISIGSTGSLNTTAGRRSRASVLAFEYRAKALAKDAASEDGVSVGRRLIDAMQGLLEAEQAQGGEGDGLMTAQEPHEEGGSHAGSAPADAQRRAWKALVARFCRAYLGRAIRSTESGVGRAGPSDPSTSSSKWQEVLTACATVERAVGQSGWDEGWVATTRFLASAYAYPDHQRRPEDGTEHEEKKKESDNGAATALELRKAAKDAAIVNGRPWLKAEACLHLAGLALLAGDIAEADTLLKTAGATRAQQQQQQQQRTATSKDGGVGSSGGGIPWAGTLSGPGGGWRELALRCLVDERLGAPRAGDATAAASLALDRVDAATVAFDDSFRVRGAPASNGGYADILGELGLARASLMLRLGRLEEARSAIEMTSPGALRATPSDSVPTAKHSQAEVSAVAPSLRLHCRALCMASELDLSEGKTEHAKGKLQEVLDADPRSADALSRLGWLLLGFVGRGSVDGNGKRVGSRREDVEAARPLLERAVAEEPGCSSHAVRLARFV